MRNFLFFLFSLLCISHSSFADKGSDRERVSINEGWKFMRYASEKEADSLFYDIRPTITEKTDDKVADSKPTEAVQVETLSAGLKPWILPSGNRFISDPAKRHFRPKGNPGSQFTFVQIDFNDSSWRTVDLPHDWGIEGPFLKGADAEVGGGMGRLASHGVAWYRRKLEIPSSDRGKSIFLDVDGAMSYAMVWLNGNLVGGWPYGYNSWRLDLTPYIHFGGENQLAIRIDNPPASARWYPGGGIYRNVWLVKTHPIHVGQWGTYITTSDVSSASATVTVEVTADNDSRKNQTVEILTTLFLPDQDGKVSSQPVARLSKTIVKIPAGESRMVKQSVKISNPRLWGPPPNQKPDLYKAISVVYMNGQPVDTYETRFGIRSVEFHPERGIIINGEVIKLQGVNQHHDLGALGAAFNKRAAERQLEMLKELGCNAIRMSHNPPAPELLELTDRMGFLVIDEIYDSWERKKTDLDFHLLFPDWYEQDTRAFVRRDRNCPSVIIWSFGNEVGEQYTAEAGALIARKLHDIIKEEDPTRPATASMNYAKPDMPFAAEMDVISLNYQGEGIRDAAAYAGLQGIRTSPLYPAFHARFPDKVIISSETASTLSTRGTYIFPVYEGNSAPAKDGSGADPVSQYVSAYEMYTAPFGASPDKVFASQDKHAYVAGEFVWSGWDYLGEPTPYYGCRSSFCGIIDLAGFKKDRFYLYQSRWLPDLPMVHILPHWNWADRKGEITPVHLFTSGDEAELFLNGESLGRKKKGPFEYRLRWDDVIYEPGELKAVAYKNGIMWAEETVKTSDAPSMLTSKADRSTIMADGRDLSFIEVKITDKNGVVVPDANNILIFSIEGPGEIVATDNGDPSDLNSFGLCQRKAFNGMALAIVRSVKGEKGIIKVLVASENLKGSVVEIESAGNQ